MFSQQYGVITSCFLDFLIIVRQYRLKCQVSRFWKKKENFVWLETYPYREKSLRVLRKRHINYKMILFLVQIDQLAMNSSRTKTVHLPVHRVRNYQTFLKNMVWRAYFLHKSVKIWPFFKNPYIFWKRNLQRIFLCWKLNFRFFSKNWLFWGGGPP
jgi:hypothetical protein